LAAQAGVRYSLVNPTEFVQNNILGFYNVINLAKKKLKWHPKVDISEGVKILLNNLNHWENAPLWDKKKIKSATKDWFKYLG